MKLRGIWSVMARSLQFVEGAEDVHTGRIGVVEAEKHTTIGERRGAKSSWPICVREIEARLWHKIRQIGSGVGFGCLWEYRVNKRFFCFAPDLGEQRHAGS